MNWHYSFFKIEPQNIKTLLNWGENLMGAYKEEALKTMEQENALREVMCLIKKEDSYIVIGAALFKGIPMKADMSNPLNQKHKKIKDQTLKNIEPTEIKGAELGKRKFIRPAKSLIVYDLEQISQ